MTQVVVVAVLVAVVAMVAVVVQRRQAPSIPVRATAPSVPDHLERADFDRPDAPWLVAAFSSATCLACQGTWDKVSVLESTEVAVQDLPFQEHKALHERYAIDAVPLVLVADSTGAVRASFVGPPSAADLWASLADLRAPGSVPPGCDHHGSTEER
jgi:hypothetical protein